MKIINVALLACAVVLGWVAREALADTGNDCATTVSFDEADVSSVSCPSAPCTANGKSGTCVGGLYQVSAARLWRFENGSWTRSGQVFTGWVGVCFCQVNEGTEESPDWVVYHSDCCDVGSVPALDGSQEHSVALLGDCDIPGCSVGGCLATGSYTVVTADCQ